jgi:2-polyprenyl-3-methyl-5-hydroxy-6-metoxy-1,4-benzoquinol methylase
MMLDQSKTTMELVRDVISRMPQSIRDGQMAQLNRFAFEVDLVRRRVPVGSTVCDIGGGWGAFSLGASAVGMQSILLDDFFDPGFENAPTVDAISRLWKAYGVEIIRRDPDAAGAGLAPGSVDVITTFNCLEHWHHSPKRMLHEAMAALRPGGHFIIGTPNSANLRKRLSALVGRTQWSAMEDWYERETFRGHVREPNVADFLYIGRDLGLAGVEVIGRNFAGTHPSRARWVRTITPWVDRLLQMRPNLCANIYLCGTKPATVGRT